MKEFVEYVAKQLVDYPRDVRVVVEEDGENRKIITLHVADSDIGKVIGKEGGNINAFRHLLRAIGAKSGNQVILKVAEDRRKK